MRFISSLTASPRVADASELQTKFGALQHLLLSLQPLANRLSGESLPRAIVRG